FEFIYFENNGNPDLQVALPYIERITIESLPLVQGETLSIRLRASQPLQVVGEIASKSLHFFSENANEYISLHGISAVAEPGAYPFRLQITNEGGDSYVIEQWVLLAPGLYINDANIIVDPTTIDSDVIATEETIFEKIITPVTETRLWDGRFSIPVTAPGWIVGDFGNRRSYNNGDYLYYHTGIDYGVDVNLNVYAPASGKVVSAQEMAIRGNALILDHGWGVYTGYWHLSEFLVSVGEIVEPGQLIAYIGNTGRSAGPHLHFEMIVTGTAVNPTQWLSKSFP
ncbi:MAG: M23 family metallopeptidase, partial [Chloroflexota bacterium]